MLMHFNMNSTRSQCLENDKFAFVLAVWNRLTDNCIQCYKPATDITIDEQLFPTKACCGLMQYIASKPDKLVRPIQFWLACDAKPKYLVNRFPYLGKHEKRSPG